MSDWISREAAIGALEDRRNKYLEDGPNWLQIQMDILTIRALPAVQPDALVEINQLDAEFDSEIFSHLSNKLLALIEKPKETE